jgi:phosphoglycolate phosphatase
VSSAPPHISVVCCGLVGTTVRDGAGQESMVERAFAEAIATQGVVAGTSDFARCMAQVSRSRGRSTVDVFGSLFPDNQARAQAASMAFERSYRAAVGRTGLTALPGAEDAIGKLTGSGVRVCLVTGLPREVATLILGTLGWRGPGYPVLCPDDVPRGFPWPDLVLTALLRFGGGDVREMAVASGTEHGLVAGRRAGAQIVAGVLTGPHTPARMRRAGATHLIESIAELPELVATAG